MRSLSFSLSLSLSLSVLMCVCVWQLLCKCPERAEAAGVPTLYNSMHLCRIYTVYEWMQYNYTAQIHTYFTCTVAFISFSTYPTYTLTYILFTCCTHCLEQVRGHE